MVPAKLKAILKDLNLEELLGAKEFIDSLLPEKGKANDHRDGGERFNANIAGSCIIEREREFFNQEHKVVISDFSSQGIGFHTTAGIIKGDFLQIYFRSPVKAQLKEIFVEVVRVEETKIDGKAHVDVGARAVDYNDVLNYRRMLAKGKASKG